VNVGIGRDHTLFTRSDGRVTFSTKGAKKRQYVNVEPA
jgi:large subunit ribosomal protein L27